MDIEDLLQERILQCNHDAVVFQSQKSWIEKTFFKREFCSVPMMLLCFRARSHG